MHPNKLWKGGGAIFVGVGRSQREREAAYTCPLPSDRSHDILGIDFPFVGGLARILASNLTRLQLLSTPEYPLVPSTSIARGELLCHAADRVRRRQLMQQMRCARNAVLGV